MFSRPISLTTLVRALLALMAMMAVLALVAFMTMVGSNGDTASVSASSGPTPTQRPGGDLWLLVLAKVDSVVSKAPDQSTATLNITKVTGQKVVAGDVVLWKGQRWTVTKRNYTSPTPTPTGSFGPGTVTLAANPCAKQNPASYPTDQKWIYLPKPCDDGNLSGVYDHELLFSPSNPLFPCISRVDHDAVTNLIKSSYVCYADVIGWGDPASVLHGVYVPGEGVDFPNPGPPPPPPYTISEPSKGEGFYDTTGTSPECQFYFPGATSCSVNKICFAAFDAGERGNMGVRFVIRDPKVNPSSGKVELYFGLSAADCDSLTIPPAGTYATLDTTSTRAAIGSVPWRIHATDFDGDGCTDKDELAKPFTRPKGCGDDPYNPLDSNQTDFSGAYSIIAEVTRGDVGAGGFYFNCLADIQQTGNGKTDGDLDARAYCYTDGFDKEVNKLEYPGVTGDGFPGGAPGYLAIPANGPPETNCARGLAGVSLDEDADTVPNDGCPSEGFGDMDSKHTVLTGRVNNATNNLELRGCFEDEDASSSVGTVYVEMQVNKNTGVGTVDIWTDQIVATCNGTYAFGDYATGAGVGPPVGSFNDAEISVVRQPGGQLRDTDQDGIPNAVELRDEAGGGGNLSNCGGRDPFNPYDWYDVNQDGVIDLLNDILGVIDHWAPTGAPPYNVTFDRPPTMTGSLGHWNRGAPDGVIDLLNDILGVIDQWHPTAC